MKINPIIYNKLLLQAQEAEEQGLTKLASGIMNAIGDPVDSSNLKYSYSELEDNVHSELWKLVTHAIGYYNLESVDAEKLDTVILKWASDILNEIETTLGVDPIKSSLELELPGETK